MDSECTASTNGRCEPLGGNGSNQVGACSYDECSSVDGCGPGFACVCRTPEGIGAANRCVQADCKSDAECASGLCVESIDQSSCDRPISYHCITSADECTADSDCKSQTFGNCQFSLMKGHFACNYSICSG